MPGGADANKPSCTLGRPRAVCPRHSLAWYKTNMTQCDAKTHLHLLLQHNGDRKSDQSYGQVWSRASPIIRAGIPWSLSVSFPKQVNRTAVMDLCGASGTPTSFPGVVQYVVGMSCCRGAKERRLEARACFSQVLGRAQGSSGAFEAYNIGGETMLRWKGGTSA